MSGCRLDADQYRALKLGRQETFASPQVFREDLDQGDEEAIADDLLQLTNQIQQELTQDVERTIDAIEAGDEQQIQRLADALDPAKRRVRIAQGVIAELRLRRSNQSSDLSAQVAPAHDPRYSRKLKSAQPQVQPGDSL